VGFKVGGKFGEFPELFGLLLAINYYFGTKEGYSWFLNLFFSWGLIFKTFNSWVVPSRKF